MKIAVTYENGSVFQHFGHTATFKIYNIENNSVVNSEIVGTNGQGHGALAGFLQERSVDTLICGGIGGGAQDALAQAGIRVFGGVTGNADNAVTALLNGMPLTFTAFFRNMRIAVGKSNPKSSKSSVASFFKLVSILICIILVAMVKIFLQIFSLLIEKSY